MECPSRFHKDQLLQHVLLSVPKPQDALHGDLTIVMHPSAGSSQATGPLPPPPIHVALLLFKEILGLIAQGMTCQAVP
jgi:hypothetical protein